MRAGIGMMRAGFVVMRATAREGENPGFVSPTRVRESLVHNGAGRAALCVHGAWIGALRRSLVWSDLGDDRAEGDLLGWREAERLDTAGGHGGGVDLEKPDRFLLRAFVVHHDPVDLAELRLNREVPLDEPAGSSILGVQCVHGRKRISRPRSMASVGPF